MKKQVLTRIIILFLALNSISCSKDDGNNDQTGQENPDDETLSDEISAPEISNTLEPFEATFFTSASLPVLPEVNWNGEEGIFSLDSESEEIIVNSETGEIRWTEKLPVSENKVVLIATNSAGSDNLEIVINNMLTGVFEGHYNFDATSNDLPNKIKFTFNENGLDVTAVDLPAEGEFSVSDINIVTGNYIYLGYNYEVHFDAVLYYPEEGYPYIEGSQYGINNPSEVGNLLVTYNPHPEEDPE